ncbi:hypothetical protein BaRGS_00015421 [Batillaria attramentaria]|uniref:Uncharacterized protein n=1 Tax=Batillaria attramentaria TaxID=370345 RepID=A0ABD0L1F2_9CAEN
MAARRIPRVVLTSDEDHGEGFKKRQEVLPFRHGQDKTTITAMLTSPAQMLRLRNYRRQADGTNMMDQDELALSVNPTQIEMAELSCLPSTFLRLPVG